mmetsp:Transcript_20175/g.40152  ORF Transcript_20175/g.40152 Transcript_20175/m.40152 type:complete len:284 (+) Transcript_20175:153-1004(+)
MKAYLSLFLLAVPAHGFSHPTVLQRSAPRRAVTRSTSSLDMATIAVFGASGLTSSECVYQALERGDTVIGLTRSPANLKIPAGSGGTKAGETMGDYDGRLTMIAGSVTNKEDVAKVFAKGALDGCIVALGGKTADVGPTMLTDGTNVIIDAMKEAGTKRIVAVTSIGAGDSENQAPFFFKILMMTAMKKIFLDKNNQEDAVMRSGLEYCVVRPGGLSVEEPTGVVNVIEGEAGSIPRADVAQFCLDAITVEDFPYINKTPCISSTGGTSWVKDRSGAARGEMA